MGKKLLIMSVCILYIFSSTVSNAIQIDKDKKHILNDLSTSSSWTGVFGGADWDQGYCAKPTNDGGYIIAGYTKSFGAGDMDGWLIKIDTQGEEEWNKTYGGENRDIFLSVIQTNDNSYIIAGFTESFGEGKSDGWVIKTDSLGNEIWSKTIGGYGNDYVRDICSTGDGGAALVGSTPYVSGSEKPCIWLRKIDTNGNRKWHTTYGENCFATSIQETSDGGFIISGEKQHDLYLVKTNQIGEISWEKTFNRVGWEQGLSVKQTLEGGFIIAGLTSDYSDENIWVLRTDSSGEEIWNRVVGSTLYDKATSVCLTSDGAYVITGTKERTDTFFDVCLIKFDKNGNKKFEKIYGGSGEDEAYFVEQTADEGFIICGYTISNSKNGGADAWVIKTDKINDGSSKNLINNQLFSGFFEKIIKPICFNNNKLIS